MQRFRIYIRNRYQTTELRRIQQCVVSEDVLDLHSSTHPCAHFHTLIPFPFAQFGSLVDLI